jgi:hypothetical protein
VRCMLNCDGSTASEEIGRLKRMKPFQPFIIRRRDGNGVELVSDTTEGRMKETILTLKHRDPFSPFNIVMNSGDRYRVENPDLLAVGKSEMTYYLPRSDRVVFIRTNQVVAVEQLEEKPAA